MCLHDVLSEICQQHNFIIMKMHLFIEMDYLSMHVYVCIDACMFLCMRSRSAHAAAFLHYEVYVVNIPHAQCITELVPQTGSTI